MISLNKSIVFVALVSQTAFAAVNIKFKVDSAVKNVPLAYINIEGRNCGPITQVERNDSVVDPYVTYKFSEPQKNCQLKFIHSPPTTATSTVQNSNIAQHDDLTISGMRINDIEAMFGSNKTVTMNVLMKYSQIGEYIKGGEGVTNFDPNPVGKAIQVVVKQIGTSGEATPIVCLDPEDANACPVKLIVTVKADGMLRSTAKSYGFIEAVMKTDEDGNLIFMKPGVNGKPPKELPASQMKIIVDSILAKAEGRKNIEISVRPQFAKGSELRGSFKFLPAKHNLGVSKLEKISESQAALVNLYTELVPIGRNGEKIKPCAVYVSSTQAPELSERSLVNWQSVNKAVKDRLPSSRKAIKKVNSENGKVDLTIDRTASIAKKCTLASIDM